MSMKIIICPHCFLFNVEHKISSEGRGRDLTGSLSASVVEKFVSSKVYILPEIGILPSFTTLWIERELQMGRIKLT